MILVYRGWGGLGFGLPLLGAILGLGSAAGMKLEGQLFMTFAGIGALLGGAAAFLLGTYLNKNVPQRKAAQYEVERRAELQGLVDEGQFQVSPGAAVPKSREEGYGQAELLLAKEVEEVRKTLTNRHTLYGIPMQWIGIVGGAIGVGIIIAGLFGS